MKKKLDLTGAKAFFSIQAESEDAQVIQRVQEVQDVQEVRAKHLILPIHDVQDVQEVSEESKLQERNTQGRKGQKLPRAHIALSQAAYEYLRTMAAFERVSMSQYVEALLIADKQKENALYQKIRELEGQKK